MLDYKYQLVGPWELGAYTHGKDKRGDHVLAIFGDISLVCMQALNEFDSKISGIDWRQKLESQVRSCVRA
jgi:hypothetical protein